MQPPAPVDAATAAAYARHLGHTVGPATLRQWVRRGHIRRPAQGRYDLADIHRHITGSDPYEQAA